MQNIQTQTADSTFNSAASAEKNVAQHDNAAARATVNVRNHFEQLTFEREAWENNALRTSNEQLYAILQKCYQTYKAMSCDSLEAAALRSGLKDYINTKGLQFKSGTHTLVKIVKCVFGNDRRRVSAYGIVLRTALAKNISMMDIPAFIRENGGVEEIRLLKAPNAMTAKKKAEVATNDLQHENMGVYANPVLAQKLDAGEIGKPVVLLGTWQADGSVVMRSIVQNETAINAALAAHYSANKSTVKQRAVEQVAANDAQIMREAIEDAASNAVANG
jgi:hypothetical protein